MRHGGRRERAKVLAWASGKRFGVQRAVVPAFGDTAPPALLRRMIRRGLQRRSVWECRQTIWLAQAERLADLRAIARRALEREPDQELCAELRALLARPVDSAR